MKVGDLVTLNPDKIVRKRAGDGLSGFGIVMDVVADGEAISVCWLSDDMGREPFKTVGRVFFRKADLDIVSSAG